MSLRRAFATLLLAVGMSAALGQTSASMEAARALEAEGKGAEAVKRYVELARSGNGKAAYRLGEIYEKGVPGVERDPVQSKKWFNAARVLGEPAPRM